jgi:hypothetical protein
MTENTTETKAKRVVNQADYNKEVEKEIAHLIYFDRLKKDEAEKKAREVIAELFEVK